VPEVHLPIRVAGLLLLAADLGLVLWLVLRSSPAEWMLDTNFTPFATVRAELAGGTLAGYREIARGVLALAPVGILLPMAGGRPYASPLGSFLRTSGAGLLLATAVEVVQTAVGGKVLNVDDVILAVLGLMLTHVAVVPAGRAAVRRRVEARAPAAPTPAPAPAPTTPA
jgi:glycopeptide antibiotics resistance protein